MSFSNIYFIARVEKQVRFCNKDSRVVNDEVITSSANAATLVSTSPKQISLILGFRLICLSRSSSDIIKISGERGRNHSSHGIP